MYNFIPTSTVKTLMADPGMPSWSVLNILSFDDLESIKAKSDAVMQASMKLGEAIYKASQEEGGQSMEGAGDMGGDSPSGSNPSAQSDDTVVDAEFEEVAPYAAEL